MVLCQYKYTANIWYCASIGIIYGIVPVQVYFMVLCQYRYNLWYYASTGIIYGIVPPVLEQRSDPYEALLTVNFVDC